jgi:hypothetical protein
MSSLLSQRANRVQNKADNRMESKAASNPQEKAHRQVTMEERGHRQINLLPPKHCNRQSSDSPKLNEQPAKAPPPSRARTKLRISHCAKRSNWHRS